MHTTSTNISGNMATNCAEMQWFVLRATYQRELIAKRKFKELGIESFVPMTIKAVTSADGKLTKKRVSALHNYIFVYTTKENIDHIKKNKIPWLRYAMSNINGTRKEIMTVPQRQMRSFIAVAGCENEKIKYLDTHEDKLLKGDNVRITSGTFEGVEGIYIKDADKKRSYCVVVRIEGIAAVATTTIPRVFVERIDS